MASLNSTFLCLGLLAAGSIPFAEAAEPDRLDEITVVAPRVANEQPAGIAAMPVTWLRYEPAVDVQARNSAEGQADVAIRGGIFENTAFVVGGLALYDPQTGHYSAEIPVAPAFLVAPQVLTGFDHARRSFNALAGTIAYDWAPVSRRGRIEFAGGPRGFNRQGLLLGDVRPLAGGSRLGVEVEFARSESQGPKLEDLEVRLGAAPAGATRGPGAVGRHDFLRANARVRLESREAVTQIFSGIQEKDFSWPNLYTPFGWPESEALQTQLHSVLHERGLGDDGRLALSAYHRRNTDDYEADTRLPGRFSPYQHETEVSAAQTEALLVGGGVEWTLRGLVLADSIDSTNLEPTSPGSRGRFASRTLMQLAVLPSKTWEIAAGRKLEASAGLTWDEGNREEGRLSPSARLRWIEPTWDASASYSAASQVAGYTALNSSPTSGLFRGNPDLGRANSGTWEAAVGWGAYGWRLQAAVFLRRDRGLTDWVVPFNPAFTPTQQRTTARFARELDVDTLGTEMLARKAWGPAEIIAGYAWLEKDIAYPGFTAPVFGSYYGGNFPRHRATLAAVLRPTSRIELRVDNEFRIQEKNTLRTGGSRGFQTSLGLRYRASWIEGLSIEGTVDNLWEEDLEEVPSVPAAPRTVSAGVSYLW